MPASQKAVSKSLRNCNVPFVMAALSSLTLSANTAIAENEIGLYFDADADTSCIERSLYKPFTLYLVISNVSVPSISGWEGALTCDPGVTVALNQLSGDGVNVRTFPEFQVGIPGEPLSAGETHVVLASFGVYATEPGGLGFKAVANPSIPDWDGALIVSGEDPGILIPVSYPQNDPDDSLASIGFRKCDSTTRSPAVEDFASYVPTGYTIFDVNPERDIGTMYGTWSTIMTDYQLEVGMRFGRIVFLGTLQEKRLECLQYKDKRPPRPYCIGLFRVDKDLKNTVGSTAIVALPIPKLPGCGDTSGAPFFDDFSVGDQLLVHCRLVDGNIFATDYGVFRIGADGRLVRPDGFPFEKERTVSDVIALSEKVSGLHAIEEAPILCLARCLQQVQNDGSCLAYRFELQRCIRGTLPDDTFIVGGCTTEYSGWGTLNMRPHAISDKLYLLTLTPSINEPWQYALTSGHTDPLPISSDGVYVCERSGIPIISLADVLRAQ